LCQVGKVNDSLLSLKYLFPIEEREFKSTSIIKAENKNIIKLKNEIQNSKDINEQHRSFLIGLIDKTKSTIPLLTNENLLDNETKVKISELANKIDQLSIEFQKEDYPYETAEQRNKRLQDAQAEGGWGASGTAVENTVEGPYYSKNG
jgi:taurine transport system permease protein